MRVGDRHVPLLSLTAEKETIWRLYLERFGENALGRTSFKYYCFLPQMRTRQKRTCLCTHCESGKQACERLEVLLADEMVDSVVSAQLNAVKEFAANLQYALLQYEHTVTQRVEEDPLDNSLRGKLKLSDLLEITVSGLDDILPACETASSDPAACEWIGKVRNCVAEIKSYERHLCGKAVQNTRQKQTQSALRDAYDRGEFIVAIVIDYKEKLPSTQKRDEVQGDYWLNSTLSLLGNCIMWFDGTDFQKHFLDIFSTDTNQDAVWTANGMRYLTTFLKSMRADGTFPRDITGVILFSDNGSHFHNSHMFAYILPELAAELGVKPIHNFCEPGEGKDACDGHFGNMAYAAHMHLIQHSIIDGIDAYVAILKSMPNTTAFAIDIVRDATSREEFKYSHIKELRQFVLVGNPRPLDGVADAAFYE